MVKGRKEIPYEKGLATARKTPTKWIVRRSSAVIIDIDMFYRLNYLVNEFHSDTRDDSLCFSEGTLQSAQGHPCFLGGYTWEQLGEARSEVTIQNRARKKIIPRPMPGGRQSPRVWYPATPIHHSRSVLHGGRSPRRNRRTHRKAPSGS